MSSLEAFASVSPKDTKSVIKGLSSTFAETIGKPEKACLVSFTKLDGYSLGGTDEPGFHAKVSSIGHIDKMIVTQI